MEGPAGRPTVLVTRPEEEGAVWVSALNERGWRAKALPLIDLQAPSSEEMREALAEARQHWQDFDALMFVSGSAVRHFFDDAMVAGDAPCKATRFWAPGPATARELEKVLARLGLPTERIDAPPADAAQFDSEHLWPVVQDQMASGRRLLVVRGGSSAAVPAEGELAGQGRDWLLRQCRDRGAEVHACMAYVRRPPHWDPALRQRVRQCLGPNHVWLFSSSEAVTNLQQVWPGFDATGTAALATHPRIAAAAQLAGFGPVMLTRPALPDVLATLECGGHTP